MPEYISQNEQVQLTGKLAEFREALNDEIRAVEKNGQTSTLLFNGRLVQSVGNETWYKFSVEYAPTMPADTPCKLEVGNEKFNVTVISAEDNDLVISSKEKLPDSIGKAILENGSTVLMKMLISRIESNCDKENSAGDRMFATSDIEIESAFSRIADESDIKLGENLNLGQRAAVISALTNDITYIWGPPGTGKTTVIGQIIENLQRADRSALVVSHTNTAVDGAISKADDAYIESHQEWSDGDYYPILRVGQPVNSLPDRVGIDYHVSVLGKDLIERKKAILEQQTAYRKRLRTITPLVLKYRWITKSSLKEIRIEVGRTDYLASEANSIATRISDLRTKISKHIEDNPQMDEIGHLREKLSELERKETREQTILTELSSDINKYESGIDYAKNEIAKWQQHTELSERIEGLLTRYFLVKEISKANDTIFKLEMEASELNTEDKSLKEQITDYYSKSAFSRMFAGVGQISRAEERRKKIKVRLDEISASLKIQIKIRDDYKAQLEERDYLEKRIKDVTPSKSVQFWRSEIERLNKLKNASIEAEKKISESICRRTEDIALVKESISKLSPAENMYNRLRRELNQSELDYERARSRHSSQIKTTMEMLERERQMCEGFHTFGDESNIRTIVDDLEDLLAQVKTELTGIDGNSLESESNDIVTQLQKLESELQKIQNKIQELENEAIKSATVVGATLTKSYLSDVLQNRKFDTVILDEASMASIPALWCAAYMAEKNIIIVGDFLQLSPIVIAGTDMAKKWLGTDMFEHSGMQERAKKPRRGERKTVPENFIMLNQQFRMEKDIASVANTYYCKYRELETLETVQRACERDAFYKWYGIDGNKQGIHTKQSIQLIDTSSLHAWVTGIPQGKRHSRFNSFSAAVDVELAFSALEGKLKALKERDEEKYEADKPDVLIVVPYKPQVDRVNKLIEIAYKSAGFSHNPGLIKVNSVHGFQGSEAEIVIFDLVIDEPHWKAGVFIERGKKGKYDGDAINASMDRLFNVAVSRAKFKLLVVGNFDYCQKRAKNCSLGDLISTLVVKMKLPKIDAKKLLPQLTFALPTTVSDNVDLSSEMILCKEGDFEKAFLADIQRMKHRMIIYSPFITENRLATYLPYFADKINAGCKIIVITKSIAERSSTNRGAYEKCEKELRSIGVNVVHKKNMHEKTILIDDRIVWNGSLNALSFTGNTGEIMQRCVSAQNMNDYLKHFCIEPIETVISTPDEMVCPICGDELVLGEADSGGVYWTCVNKDFNRNIDAQYPHDGILRCTKCNLPYKFVMKNEPRWVCPNDPKHYQKVRKGDLGLDKMAALIPTKKVRKEVDSFFARKENDSTKGTKKTTSVKATKSSAPKKAETGSAGEQLRLFDL